MEKVNLAQKLTLFNDYWHPRIVGEVNESQHGECGGCENGRCRMDLT